MELFFRKKFDTMDRQKRELWRYRYEKIQMDEGDTDSFSGLLFSSSNANNGSR